MQTEAVKGLILASMPDADVEVRDMTGTGDHFNIFVAHASFKGLTLVEQHKKVFDALSAEMDRGIHAVQLRTRASAAPA